jgi:DNA-binding NtrC family response regulator
MLEAGLGSIRLSDEFVRDLLGDKPHIAEAKEARPARPRVLVVDDERLIADTCAKILDDAGFYAKTAYDGWKALEMVAEFQPDYLITDVLMPRMNGVDLAISVSRMLPAVKVLLFSGQAGISGVLLEGRAQGYEFELIAKPIHPTKLIEHLRKYER